ncbi:IS66 family transposase [Marinagarivorans cellulosilyticus]|uniref:Transposase n=1 Tax=Marinagarivorans cellulosilyticus TaxID=2721545 RepID=A0AAN1WLM6_9GAMM|nr:IS66 family transposase [Marinagarivorans cellulosilyticus]BCD99865.1 transposase [Marinagarivorans cellulosilyticus]
MENAQDLQKQNKVLREQLASVKAERDFLLEQFNLARHRQFSPSSEKVGIQPSLFNEAETEASSENEDITEEAAQQESNVPDRPKAKPKRKPLPKDLPRETRIVDIADEEKVCPCCNGELHQFGEESSEQLEYIPASVKVIETVRPKYACRTCEKSNTHTPIKIADVPASPIPKSIATPNLLAQIIIQKYQFALPLYRQEQLFKQLDITLSRKTLANWMIRCADVCKPIVKHLKDTLLEQSVIHADETPLKVINDDKQKSYMWVYCTGSDSPETSSPHKNIVLYDYHPSRAASCPKSFLGDYSGYLQVDGYAGYHNLKVELVGCMAHARRKFIEAQRAQPKGKTGRADWAVLHIQKLYRIESTLKGLSAEEKLAARKEKTLPLLDEFKIWLDKTVNQVAPKTAIGKAVEYTLRQWHKLIRFCESGELTIDNNRAERAIKPFVIGRKNWLFCNTSRGAHASAILYSLIETAKANGIDCYAYLSHLLNQIPKENCSLDELMPWRFNKA